MLVFTNLLSVVFILRLFWMLRTEKKSRIYFEKKNQDTEREIHSKELDNIIRYKLNPHLFKNILNSIQSHAFQTYHALDKLAGVLDYILYESDRKFVSPKEEVDFILNLIEINRLKVSPLFDLRIKNRMDTSDPTYNENLMLPLITVDLVENAFKHADLQSDNSFISIMIEMNKGVFFIAVSNKISAGKVLKKEKSGFGKESLDKRLSVIYKEYCKLERFVEEDTYVARLKIDLIGYKNKMHLS